MLFGHSGYCVNSANLVSLSLIMETQKLDKFSNQVNCVAEHRHTQDTFLIEISRREISVCSVVFRA